MVTKKVVAALAAMILVGAVGLMSAQAAPQENRPFEAVTSGTSRADLATATADEVPFTATGEMIGTHIGRADYVITGVQNYGRHTEEEHPSGDCAFVEDDEAGMTITAPDGSTMVGNIDDDRSVICVTEEALGPGPDDAYLSTLYIELTGGTGRFADASGWLFARGSSTFSGLEMTDAVFDDVGQILGDIDY